MFEILHFVTRRGFILQNDSIIYSECRLALHYKYTFLIKIPKIEEHRQTIYFVQLYVYCLQVSSVKISLIFVVFYSAITGYLHGASSVVLLLLWICVVSAQERPPASRMN